MDRIKAQKGVYAAVATPINERMQPDHDRLTAHCRWLLDNGCDGLVPLGTTGEATSLGLAAKTALVTALKTSGLPMERMIIGTGSTSIEDTTYLSETALDAGAAGLLILPPFYYSDPGDDGLFDFFSEVAMRLATRGPQIYLYHIPHLTGVSITVNLTRRLREAFPGIFVGIKDSSGDFSRILTFLKAIPGFAAFSGSEIFAMQNLIAGGWGCITATTNITAPAVACRIRNNSSDAKTLDQTILALRQRLTQDGTISRPKAYLALLKSDDNWRRTLPPNRDCVDTDLSLKELFDSLQPIADLSRLYGPAIA